MLQSLAEGIAFLIEATKALAAVITLPNLLLVSFIEAIFFPVPPDVVLIPLVIQQPSGGLLFAALTTVASVMGAVVGYAIGLKGGRPVLSRFASEQRIAQAKKLLDKYDAWAIAVAAFTPIPYKVFAIAAGVFVLDWKRFVLVSLFARGARFTMVAALLMIYGQEMAGYFLANFEWITIGVAAVAILAYVVLRWTVKRRASN